MKKHLFYITLLTLLFVSLFGYTGQAQESDKEYVDLVIHKLLLGDKHLSDESLIQNDGSLNPTGLELLKNPIGLNDVEFSIYDVTTDFYQLRGSGKSIEESQKELSQKEMKQEPIERGVTKKEDTGDGILRVTLPKKQQKEDAVYLIKETSRPENVKEGSIPVVIILPVYAGNVELKEVHLYIKNDRDEPDVPSLIKSINHKENDFSYGEKISYKIETEIPQDILQYESYELSDEADDELWIIKGESDSEMIKVTLDGKEEEDYYQIKEIKDHGFTIEFDPQKLGDYVGEVISVTYDMELRGSYNNQQVEFNNTVQLIAGNRHQLEASQKVVTGGYHFQKVDMDKPNNGLSGAEFIIMNKDNNYMQENDKKGVTWGRDKSKAKKVISDKQGKIDLLGLGFGKYSLIEMQAPSGYIQSQQPINFEITKTSEKETQAIPLKIVNKAEKKPEQPGKPSVGGALPQTNDTYNRVWAVVGVLIVIFIIYINTGGKKK